MQAIAIFAIHGDRRMHATFEAGRGKVGQHGAVGQRQRVEIGFALLGLVVVLPDDAAGVGDDALIQNQRPVIGVYGVQSEGSSDMYYKGGNLLHTVRQLVDDDVLWKEILRGLNRDFRHQVVTSAQVEEYIAKRSGLELGPVFDQYLRHSRIPVLQYAVDDGAARFRWVADVKEFAMPIRVRVGGDEKWIEPTVGGWTEVSADGLLDPSTKEGGVLVDPDFYVEVRRVDAN